MFLRSSAAALAFSGLVAFTLAQEAEQACPFKPTWNKCLGQDNERIQCATIQVPNDYTDTSDNPLKISLNLIRYAAVNTQGDIDDTANSIIINPGGPGESGIDYVLNSGKSQASQAGDKYHIIGFDPRGVGVNNAYNWVLENAKAEPESKDFTNKDVLQGIYEANSDVAQKCNAKFPDDGKLIGTIADARDVHTIAQRVGVNGDTNIRYWGFSYGTLLGDTIARLFPKEIAGMVLDGNINPNDYWLNQLPNEEASSIDDAIVHFFDLCAAATTSQCVWKDKETDTSAILLQKWDNWVGADYTQANRGRSADGISIDDSYYARRVMYIGIKDGDLFPKCASVLSQWYTGKYKFEWVSNLKKYTPVLLGSSKRGAVSQDDNGNFNPTDSGKAATSNELIAITGADNAFSRGVDIDGTNYGEWLQSYYEKSKYAGDLSIGNLWSYAPWISRSKEWFSDRFADIETSPGKIIYIQTPYDPVTPLKSGQAAHEAFTNSRIVYVDGLGHCSSGSKKLKDAIKAYWTDNAVPDEATKYPLDDNSNPFQNPPEAEANEDAENAVDAGTEQKRSIKDLLSMFDRRDIDPTPQEQGSCDDTNSTTTTSSTSSTTSTSTSTTTGKYNGTTTTTTGTFNISASYTGYSTSTTTPGKGYVSPTYTDTASTWLQWSTSTRTGDKPAATAMWGSWDPHAIPTVTTYTMPLIGVCESGLTTSTVTVTATCPSGCKAQPTGIPQGYTTTQVYCWACAVPSTVTVTVKATGTSLWSAWADPASPTSNTVKTGTWTAWPADPSAKTSGTGTWSAWATDGSGKPVDASTRTASTDSWSTWADASGTSTTGSAASVKPTEWANVPLATAASSTSASGSNWGTWGNPSPTSELVAKYTGGAASHAVVHGGALVALAAAALVL